MCRHDLNDWITKNGVAFENTDSNPRTKQLLFVVSDEEFDLFFC